MFSPGFAEALRLGKYTRWVTDAEFHAEHLIGVLWMVGEYDAGARTILDLLFELRPQSPGADRAFLALEAMHAMVRGERFEVAEWAQRIARGRGHLLVSDLPQAVHAALESAARGAAWTNALMIPEGYETRGTDAAGQPVYAYLSVAGNVNELRATRRPAKLELGDVISAEVGQALMGNRQTQWAVGRELSEQYLRCLLWLVGEFGARAYTPLELLKARTSALAEHLRALSALEVLSRMCLTQRFALQELEQRMEHPGAA